MKILLLGGGGREHALAWKLRQSARVEGVYAAPGNAGIAQEAQIEQGDVLNPAQVADLAQRLHAGLTMVGPEAPLVAGVVDEFEARGLRIVGPTAAAARLEGSKIFAKEFMRRHGIPTADFVVCHGTGEARINLGCFGFPVVLKADGLAAGKGVVVAQNASEAEATTSAMLQGQLVGEAGYRLVLERFLQGEEVTFTVLSDGRNLLALPPTQDHKAVFDGDRGPNTGGMGAYCDDDILSPQLTRRIIENIVRPTLDGMAAEGAPFRGVLYVGLMMTAAGPQVLEYNVRFGDPETQPLMMRLASDLLPLLEAVTTGTLDRARPEWAPGATVCVAAASGGYPGEYQRDKPITGIEDAEALPGVKVFHAGTRLRDGQYVTAGGRVLGITAPGSSLRDAIACAYAAVERITFEGMHCRRDIGRKGLNRQAPGVRCQVSEANPAI
jgi:phosphoribosylamine--glycine ligase